MGRSTSPAPIKVRHDRPQRACLRWAGAVLLPPLVLLLSLPAKFLWATVSNDIWPHSTLLHKATHSSLPVIPLLASDALFDIGVSVYVRIPKAHAQAFWHKRIRKADREGTRHGTGIWNARGEPLTNLEMEDFEEQVLFSDVVFRGVTLRSKHALEEISFELPTERFCDEEISFNDLRASFFIIPTSPSLFDHVVKWSYWIPAWIVRPPARPWPFPLGSTDERAKTIQDHIIEDWAVSVPLLQLRNPLDVSPHLWKPPKPRKPTREKSALRESDTMMQGDEDVEEEREMERVAAEEEAKWEAKRLADSVRQPFVVTRTQVRAVDYQSHFDLTAFNARHNALKATSCGQEQFGPRANRRLCKTDASTVPFETRMKLEIPQADGATVVQRAYAPHIGFNILSNGVLDLQRIPVNRTNIGADVDSQTSSRNPLRCIESKRVNVTWHISYSGRTPEKSWVADRALQFFHDAAVSINSTALEKAVQHDSLELAHGVGGHRFHPAAHPRRRLALKVLSYLLRVMTYILDIVYWQTLRTTDGISIPAAIVDGVGTLVISACTTIFVVFNADPVGERLGTRLAVLTGMLVGTVSLLPSFSQVLGAGRLEVKWRGILPVVKRVTPTHREKASQRVDAQTGWKVPALVFAAVLVLNLFAKTQTLDLIPSLLPRPTSADLLPQNSIFILLDSLQNALAALFAFSQVSLNAHSRTFAGRAKLASWLDFTHHALGVVIILKYFSGKWDGRPGWSMCEAVQLGFLGALAGQACFMPGVLGDRDFGED